MSCGKTSIPLQICLYFCLDFVILPLFDI
uniref:Uncharacterized protein n=1 Tax=Arundo donax TaxID=35708 RepID=A0A0A8ZQA4_ARUDO